MAESEKIQPAWQKHARLALIPILGIVLLVVCLLPDGEALPETVNSPGEVPATADNQPGKDANSANTDQLELPQREQIPPIALDSILQHDPFALSAEVSQELRVDETPSEEELAEQTRERVEVIVESLQAVKLNMILRGEKGTSAILGDRVLHEGDEIEPGVRIRKITAKGLTLEVADDYEPVDDD